MRILIGDRNRRLDNYIRAFSHFPEVKLYFLNEDRSPEGLPDCDALLLPGGDDIDPALFGQPFCGTRDVDRKLDDVQLFLAALYGTKVVTNSYHHQAIGRLAAGFSVLQTSDDGVIEFAVHDTLPLYAVQWHPEKAAFETAEDGMADGGRLFSFFLDQVRSRMEKAN